MGTIIKKGKGYEAQVARKGIRKSSMFRTKAEANMWIAETEKAILQGKYGKPTNTLTFNDLMQRYAQQVSPTKRGAEWEIKRIKMLSRYGIASIPLDILNQTHFAEWRDKRLSEVTPATVLREWNLISNALNIAVNEWKWLQENPLKGVRKPKHPQARTRLISQDEIDRLLYALGYDYSSKLETITSRVGACFLFAIETAMRAGEIASLTWDNVDMDKRVAHLPMTKNGFPRDVPLSTEAIRIIDQLKSVNESVETVFNLNTSQIDSLFRKAKSRAIIEDVTFHDSRATAITRLSKKVDIMTLARISGHRDLKILMIYYRESMADIAKRI